MAIYVALGANQKSQFGNRENTPSETFSLVFNELENRDIHVDKVSALWESPAWPDPYAQPAYKNAVIEVTHSGVNSPLLIPLTAIIQHNFSPYIRINAGGNGVVAAVEGEPNWLGNLLQFILGISI